MGVWSDATNGWDPGFEDLLPEGTLGYAGVWHANQPPQWTGPSGYYKTDLRAELAPSESMTWSPIHVWASNSYAGSTMSFTIQGSEVAPPPLDREYSLRLDSVPKAVTGAPAIGTIWSVPLDGPLTLVLPTYRDASGEDAYKFSFTISAVVPEPAGAAMLVVGIVLCQARRRRASR